MAPQAVTALARPSYRALLLLVCLDPAFAQPAEKLFVAHCAPCHGMKGEGGKGPDLAVQRLSRAPDDAALNAMIRFGIPGTEMPGSRVSEDEARSLVGYVRRLGRTAPAGAAGNAARGREIFAGKGNCARCHTINGYGGSIGPDLSTSGARRSGAFLRESLLKPEASVPDNFTVYRRITPIPDSFLQIRVVTADGRSITGVRLNEDTFTIQLRDLNERVHSFDKGTLKEFHRDWGKSPMPSYQGVLSESELADVVAYLASLRGGR
ncbi:MAG: c-type cytochrome [Bryobacteraceae bacterium]